MWVDTLEFFLKQGMKTLVVVYLRKIRLNTPRRVRRGEQAVERKEV